MGDGIQPGAFSGKETVPGQWWKRSKGLFRWSFRGIVLVTALLFVTVLYLKSKPLPAPPIGVTTQIYDIRGKIIDHLDRGEHREPVQMSQLPPWVHQASQAAEDQRFYTHWGFSPKGILRAAWVNLKEGRLTQGASTITQQLARNLYLTHDRTWSRKIKEAALTVQLELHFSKDEIMEMYLNKIYYGHGAYGVERAAHTYFRKKAKDLSLAEAAMLAGIPRGPKWYSPLLYPKRAIKRQQAILDQMAKLKLISRQQALQAKKETLAFASPPKPTPARAPYFRDYVIQSAIHQFGLDEATVRSGGLRIYTTLDLQLQEKGEEILKQQLQNRGELQGALVSIQPKTGHIKAMVGGKDYVQSPFNRVFGKRQPGSTFKPILYLAALQNGMTPTTQFASKPTSFPYPGGIYRPTNFRNRYAHRLITMGEAIATSDNIYAVHTQQAIGEEQTVELAHHMGINSPLQKVPALALGSSAVSPYEMAQVYATLAAGGVHRLPTGILRIEDAAGNLLAQSKQRATQVASPAESFVLTHMLKGVFAPGGTASRVRQIVHRPLAGKTGSTHWDSWLSGFSPDLATTVWVGYDQGKELPEGASRQTHNIWGLFMQKALAGKPIRDFHPPQGVVRRKVDPASGLLATSDCPRSMQTYFVQGTEPTRSCPTHTPVSDQPASSPSLWERIKKWWTGS